MSRTLCREWIVSVEVVPLLAEPGETSPAGFQSDVLEREVRELWHHIARPRLPLRPRGGPTQARGFSGVSAVDRAGDAWLGWDVSSGRKMTQLEGKQQMQKMLVGISCMHETVLCMHAGAARFVQGGCTKVKLGFVQPGKYSSFW